MKSLHELTDELTSPLFRIMSAYNFSDPAKAQYLNNISSFHIGKGIILSVCHNLRLKSIPGIITEDDFQNNLLNKVTKIEAENKNLEKNIDSLSNKVRFEYENKSGEIQIS